MKKGEIENQCVACGQTFFANRKLKLCSKPCRDERAKQQRVVWFAKHKKRMQAYWRKYHEDRRVERSVQASHNYYRRKREAA